MARIGKLSCWGSRQGQGTADTGPAVGGNAGVGRGCWWRTARAVGALLTAMEGGGGGEME